MTGKMLELVAINGRDRRLNVIERLSKMIDRIVPAPPLNLARKTSDPEILVDVAAFFEFSFWMAEELQDLICQFQSNERRLHDQRLGKIYVTDSVDTPYEHWVEWE